MSLRITKKHSKTREWERIRSELKKRFMAVGITTCEIQWAKCWRDNGLSFAHSRKRLDPKYDAYEVVLACAACHTALEGMRKESMFAIVSAIINNRKRQPVPVDNNDSTVATLAEGK